MSVSPYAGKLEKEWLKITIGLIDKHPLRFEIADIVLDTWKSIFSSQIGIHGFRIGKDIIPKPQIMGFLLHELIALEVAARYPKKWRGENANFEKDLVCVSDPSMSVEIKTSSNASKIFGNRSYAQEQIETGKLKPKSGYYLTVNFPKIVKGKGEPPPLTKIAFGWIDHTDWVGQKSATGQQASLRISVYQHKLVTLFPVKIGR